MRRWSVMCALVWALCGMVPPVAADGGGAIRYLALGDSYAVGVGATDPTTGGYAGLFTASLTVTARTTVTAFNVAEGGATSADLIGDYTTRGAQGDGQLARAVQLLSSGGVNVVTLDIGGNDLYRLSDDGQPCAGAAFGGDTCLAAVQETLRAMSAPNLPRIVNALVAAAPPDAQILVLTYPNPYALGANDPTEQRTDAALRGLNGIIAGAVTAAQPAAAQRGVTLTLVDLFPLFAGRAGALTHIRDPRPDIHPTDAGYRVIATALAAAYRTPDGTPVVGPDRSRLATRLGG